MNLPDGTRRLFAHFDTERLDDSDAPLILERLLEDGDGDDLRWLAGALPEVRWVNWFEDRAHRRLSRRSRAFWAVVLDVAPENRPDAAEALWPL